MSSSTEAAKLFVSYSSSDSEYCAELLVHLKPLSRTLNVWHAGDILPGADQNEVSARALADAKVAILLLTPDYLASDWHMDRELSAIAEYEKMGRIRSVLVVLRDCSWVDTPLGNHQVLYGEHPIANYERRADRDRAWKNVAQYLHSLAGANTDVPAATFSGLPTSVSSGGDSIDELIQVLKDRAEAIITSLSQHYTYAAVADYIDRFRDLHAKHLDALKRRQMVRAHEVLSQIHALSHKLESHEFWARHDTENPGVCYYLPDGIFDHGVLLVNYVLGKPTARLDDYDTLLRMLTKQFAHRLSPENAALGCHQLMALALPGVNHDIPVALVEEDEREKRALADEISERPSPSESKAYRVRLSATGPNRIRVMSLIRKHWRVSILEAKALLDSNDWLPGAMTVGGLAAALRQAGATLEFEAVQEPTHKRAPSPFLRRSTVVLGSVTGLGADEARRLAERPSKPAKT